MILLIVIKYSQKGVCEIMQDNVKAKWDVTDEELKQAADELCAKGIGKGCFQNTNALLALLDLISAGDIAKPKEQ